MSSFDGEVSVNGDAYQVIGMNVGLWGTPPGWYFQDLAAHGINTVYYTYTPEARGNFSLPEVKRFVDTAYRYGLRSVVGLPLAGAKSTDWRERLSGFRRVIDALRDNPAVIGWYALDEPTSGTWSDTELNSIYAAVRSADPYRPVFVNWAGDGIPVGENQEPIGGLRAVDVYSFDTYPVSRAGVEMGLFVANLQRVAIGARHFGRAFHGWIQIFGGNDAAREPTVGEMREMVYRTVMEGGGFSYWDTKSNSGVTWAALAKLNIEVASWNKVIHGTREAEQVVWPRYDNTIQYSAWVVGSNLQVLAFNPGEKAANLVIPVAALGLRGETTPLSPTATCATARKSGLSVTLAPHEACSFAVGAGP